MSMSMEHPIFEQARPKRFVLSGHGIYPAHDNETISRMPSYEIIKELGLQAIHEQSPHSMTMRAVRDIMRERYMFDNDNMMHEKTISPQLAQDVSSLYGLLAQDINYLNTQIDATVIPQGSSRKVASSKHLIRSEFIGNKTESTVTALLSKDLVGSKRDTVVVIPATMRQDRRGYDTDGYNRGFDTRVIYRDNNDAIDIQIKTTQKRAEAGRYHPSILVASLELIAGGMKRVRALEDAITAHVNGTAGIYQLDHIQSAHAYLFDELQNHREKLARNN